MFCTPSKTVTARVLHKCTYCGESIEVGSTYLSWKSVDDSWFQNKMHHECADDQAEWGDGEYFPYQNKRPQIEGAKP